MKNTRRTFMKQAGIGISAALLSPFLFSCENSNKGSGPFHSIGLQLYTLRDLLTQDPTKTLETIAKVGYSHVETFGFNQEQSNFWNLSVDDLKKILIDNNLKSHSGHYDMANYLSRHQTDKDSIERYIETAHKLGQTYIIAPVSAMDNINALTVEDYQYAAEQLNKAGEMSQKAGIKIGYHNHFWEFRSFANGTKGLDILLAFTEPNLVDFELDLFWTEKSGLSPQSYFEKYPGRFPLWHIKDMDRQYTKSILDEEFKDAGLEDIMKEIRYTEVGSGAIDFKNISTYAEKAGLKHAFVEQDDIYIPNKFESIKKSYKYVQDFLIK